jgi:hypothetical protein
MIRQPSCSYDDERLKICFKPQISRAAYVNNSPVLWITPTTRELVQKLLSIHSFSDNIYPKFMKSQNECGVKPCYAFKRVTFSNGNNLYGTQLM